MYICTLLIKGYAQNTFVTVCWKVICLTMQTVTLLAGGVIQNISGVANQQVISFLLDSFLGIGL